MNYIKYFLIVLTLFVQTVSAQSLENPKITYFHNDITGTPIAASDEEGNIIWREERRAYGEIKVDPLKPKSLEEFSVGFTGHQADRESGLTYAKARYYNKAIGRFYAPDPIPFRESDLTSINRYAYAANNPYKYVDPTGKEPMRGDSDWDTVNRWGSINSAFNQVGYGLDTYKGEIAVVATGVGAVSVMGTAAIVAGAKEAVSEIASEITGGLSDFVSFKGLFSKGIKRAKPGSYRPDRALPRDKYGNPVPDTSAPHTQLGTKKGRKGNYTQAREFDAHGKPVRDIDFTDHGRPQNHPNPHQHSYKENATGGTLTRSKKADPLDW